LNRNASVKPSADAPACFFVADGEVYHPTRLARGPWGPQLSGNYVGGLLARAVERQVSDPDLQPARLTVDLLRPVAPQPLQVDAHVVRQGRRLQLVDALMIQEGTMVARASALFLRRGEHTTGTVWTSPISMPAVPDESVALPNEIPMFLQSYGRDPVNGSPGVGVDQWRHNGQKFAWVRETKFLIDNEELTPFTRAAMAADMTSSLTNWSTAGLQFVNADYTLSLSRLPKGAHIGLAAVTHYGQSGVATGVATIFDREGPIGSGMATALSNPGFAPPPSMLPG
jgi:hypothetical protein